MTLSDAVFTRSSCRDFSPAPLSPIHRTCDSPPFQSQFRAGQVGRKGGGLGNLIDRIRLGYVVDMFNFQFMSYPVFNVADILVVCGTIGFAAYYLLLHDKLKEKTPPEETDDGTGTPDGPQ